MTPRLTVTYGLRWVLEAPPYETNGYQVAPCVEATGGGCTNQNVADWFNHSASWQRRASRPTAPGRFRFILGGPRITVRVCGTGTTRIFHRALRWLGRPIPAMVGSRRFLAKRDQFSIRGGYSIMYDHFGVPVVNSFDQNGSFGLSTDLGNPRVSVSAGQRAPLYVSHSGVFRPVLLACAVSSLEQLRVACLDPHQRADSPILRATPPSLSTGGSTRP